MNFKQIEMVGFKSFADPIKIQFEEGINAIVGPNGCGKSNVADAIKWVLGEQSSKNLRGTNMQDVIFKGTEKRKGLSFCEVTLHFNNQNKIFNTPYEEFTITRKLYRTGESEYQLNGNNCRLKDIQEILHDTGVGKSGYSIISQGMVDKIVNSKPEDRRAIFEEAAGIAGFKAKKIEAERRLDKTQINLDSINNVISEVERQLKPLQKQSETAKVYLELKEKLKLLELNAYIYQYDYASDNKASIQTKIDAIVEELDLRQNELDKTIDDYSKNFDSLNNTDIDLKRLNDKILELTVGLEKQTGETNIIREKVRFLISEDERLAGVLEKCKIDKTDIENQLIVSELNKKSKEAELIGAKNTCADLEQSYLAISTELQSGENEAMDTQKKLFESLSKLGDVKAKISALNAEKTTYSENLIDANIQKDAISSKLIQASMNEEEATKNLNIENENKSNLDSIVTNTMREANNKLGDIKLLESEIVDISNNLISMYQKKKIYEEMQKEFEGFSGSVKRLLSDAQNNKLLNGKITGVIANLIKVPEKYQTAIEMALGNAVQNVVTETEENAKQLITYLKERQYGRITFLPINSVKPRYFEDKYKSKLSSFGCLGLAKDLISYPRNIENVMSSLLGSTVIVDELNNAVKLAKETNFSFRIVTLDGDILSPQGSMTGGSKKAQGSNLLSRETDIEQTTKIIEKLESEKSLKSNRLLILQNEHTKLNEAIKQNSNLLNQSQVEVAKLSEVYNNYNVLKTELESQLNKVNSDIAKYNQMMNSIDNELQHLQGDDTNIVVSENYNSGFNQFSDMKAQRDELNQNLLDVKVLVASLESEIFSLSQEVDRLKVQKDILENNTEQYTQDKLNNLAILSQYKERISENENDQINSQEFSMLNSAKEKREKLENGKTQMQALLRQLDDERLRLTSEVSRLQDKKYQQDLNLTKIDTDIETMQDRVWTEYELTYTTALPYKLEVFDLKAGLQEISKLRKDIMSLGNVNVNAIEDYKLLVERHGGMYTQAQDLIKAENDIKKIIKDLADEMTEKFEVEFAKINSNFGIIFTELFGGGKARLELIDNDDPLQAGVEIFAEPPEKKLHNTQLLSGGEKALVAIAILFAILRLKPMPFCLLDEIEAPLDEANVYRFVQYLKRYSNETQFILITHKKPTMENADVLYGITMEEKGVSKVVSVKLSDAIKMAEIK